MPFKLREFMVKNWKRHRNVLVTIDELVDKTFDDLRDRKLDLTQRSQVNAIKPEKLIKVNSLLEDVRRVVEKEVLQELGSAFNRLGIKLKEVNDIEHAMAAEVVNLMKNHRDLIVRGQLGASGKAQYESDLKNSQFLTRMTIISTKRKRDRGINADVTLNLGIGDKSVHECNVPVNKEASPVVCVPTSTKIKTSKRKHVESHQSKLSDFGTRRIYLRLLDVEVD